jgi:hypothetical protein
VAKPGLDRIVDADVARRRFAIDQRAHRPARAANDNGIALARNLDRLWPLAAALLVLVWALLSVFS